MKCNLKTKLEFWLTQHWYSSDKTWLAYLLWPCACLFSFFVNFRRYLYKKGYLSAYRSPCPVIVVGNVCLGGVGKTPLVIALYDLLKKRGWTPGIVTRGYKGNYKNSLIVDAQTSSFEAGDEAVLMAKRTGAPIVANRDRGRAIQTLLSHYGCDIILSDDGLQHYSMQRDIEIVVVDATKQHGNGLCLPAGPLREPVDRLDSVSMVIVNGGQESECAFSLQNLELIHVVDQARRKGIAALSGQQVNAVTAIGSPQRFFESLRSLGAIVIPYPYPDHYFFKQKDFHRFSKEVMIVMTEKDAVKCQGFTLNNAWFLSVEAHLNAAAIEKIEKLLPCISPS